MKLDQVQCCGQSLRYLLFHLTHIFFFSENLHQNT